MNILLLTSCYKRQAEKNNTYYNTDKIKINSLVVNDSLKIVLQKENSNLIELDNITIPNDVPKLNFGFTDYVNNIPYVIVGISYNENYRNYEKPNINWAKYYMTMIYRCNENYECKYDDKLSMFFGSGGDLVNYDNNQLLSTYIYKDKSVIQKALKSPFFNKWSEKKQINGYTIQKTMINNEPFYDRSNSEFLNKNTKFVVIDSESDFLYINYMKKNKNLRGWIKCKDTNLCDFI